MLRSKEYDFQPCTVSLDTLVPPDNFYRQLDAKIDPSFMRDYVQHLYKPFGRPSIDPVVYFKLQLIMFFEAIRSERQLMSTVAMRLDHRWYLHYDLNEPLPHHSSLTRIRDRYGVVVFRHFFESIIQQCIEAGLVWGEELHFDGTMIHANADHSHQVPRFYHQAQQHLEQLFEEPVHDSSRQPFDLIDKYDGTRSLVKPNSYHKRSDYWVSPVDASATPTGKQQLGYHLQYGVDGGKSRIILSCLVTPSAIQDNTPFLDLVRQTHFRWQLPLHTVVADTRFGTIENVVGLEDDRIRAFMPLHLDAKRSSGKRKTYGSDQFHYDAQRNVYICPQQQVLRFWTTDNHSQRIVYKAPDKVCNQCPVKSQCKTGQSGRRVGHSIFKPILDRVRAYQQGHRYKKAMRKRQVWVEPKFAELKQWHLGRRFRLRGIRKVNIEALLKATGQNIKQLLKAKSCQSNPKPPASAAILAGWIVSFCWGRLYSVHIDYSC